MLFSVVSDNIITQGTSTYNERQYAAFHPLPSLPPSVCVGMSDSEPAISDANSQLDDDVQDLLEPMHIPAPVHELSIHQLRDVSSHLYLLSLQ